MNLHKMIEICLKDDNMHTFIMINALICINNYVITCINSMLSQPPHRHLRGLLLPTPASGPTSGEVEEVDFDEEVNDDLGGTVHAGDPDSAA